MAGMPRPWYWAARDGWYATVERRRRLLARGKAARAAARRRLLSLLTEEPGVSPGSRPVVVDHGGATQVEAGAAFMAAQDARVGRGEIAARSRDNDQARLAPAVAALGHLRVAELEPYHVLDWLDGRPTWGPTTRHIHAAILRHALGWAKRVGRIAADPLADMPMPRRRPRRPVVMSVAKARLVLERVEGPFRDDLTFLWATGCRPGEAARITATDVDRGRGVVALRQHKTAHCGRERIIALTPQTGESLQRLALRYPTGPLFRTARAALDACRLPVPAPQAEAGAK